MYKYLGVIPARGGSKGINDKNIKLMNGKPLIEYTVAAAKTAVEEGILSRCIVSTESEQIAKIARECGGDVPFLRPAELAEDTSKTVDALAHALKTLEEQGEKYDAVVTFQPTSPMRIYEDIKSAVELFNKSDSDSLVSVYEDFKANGFNYYRMGQNNQGIPLHAVHNTGVRRQDMQPMYVRNGAIYISKTCLIIERALVIGDCPLLYVMPKSRSTDIDSIEDFEYAEWLMVKNSI